MSRENLETLAGFDIPNTDTFVERSAHNQVGLKVEGTAKDIVGMAGEGLDALAGGEFPYLNGFVIGRRTKKLGVGGPRDV